MGALGLLALAGLFITILLLVEYIGEGPRLVTVDVSDPDHPCRLGQSEVLPDLIRDVTVADGYAYVAAGVAGLQVFSLAQPAHPEKTASITTRAAAERVVVDNRRACVASGCVTLYQLQNTGRRRGVLSLRPGS